MEMWILFGNLAMFMTQQALWIFISVSTVQCVTRSQLVMFSLACEHVTVS